MSFLFPRFAYAPVRCAPVVRHHDLSPLWSLFDDATRQIQQAERHHAARRSQFNPRFDLKEDKESYILEGEVPGFKDDELSIEWNDNILAIRGKHESVVESGKKPEVDTEKAASAAAAQDIPTALETSETSSVKSHQATVEDEEPANGSTVATEKAPEQQQRTVTAPAPAQPEVQHLISERRSGQFLRQFQFPSAAVNFDAIKASLQSGILKIVVPKAPVPESRRINIE